MMTLISVEQIEHDILEWAKTNPEAIKASSGYYENWDPKHKAYVALENLLSDKKSRQIVLMSGLLRLEEGVVDHRGNGKENYWITFSFKEEGAKRRFFMVGGVETLDDVYWENAKLIEADREVKKTVHFSTLYPVIH